MGVPSLTASDRLAGPAENVSGLVGREASEVDALRVVEIEPLGREVGMFDITTGTGDFIAEGVISHNCFARPTHRYLDLNPREDFERETGLARVGRVGQGTARLMPQRALVDFATRWMTHNRK